jgi:uncharacterized protein (TIGR02996 family)
MLADIEAGQHDVALALADWLQDHGLNREARLLRVRYARFLNARARLESFSREQELQLNRELDYLRLRATLQGLTFEAKASWSPDFADINSLFVGYCGRLIRSLSR